MKNKKSKLKGNLKKALDSMTGDFDNFDDVPNPFNNHTQEIGRRNK